MGSFRKLRNVVSLGASKGRGCSSLLLMLFLFMSIEWDDVSELRLLTSLLSSPTPPLGGDVWVWRSTVELYWQGKHRRTRRKICRMPLSQPHIPRGLTRAWTWASAARGRRLNAWSMARPRRCTYLHTCSIIINYAESYSVSWRPPLSTSGLSKFYSGTLRPIAC
jgi:hypothetical protein